MYDPVAIYAHIILGQIIKHLPVLNQLQYSIAIDCMTLILLNAFTVLTNISDSSAAILCHCHINVFLYILNPENIRCIAVLILLQEGKAVKQ